MRIHIHAHEKKKIKRLTVLMAAAGLACQLTGAVPVSADSSVSVESSVPAESSAEAASETEPAPEAAASSVPAEDPENQYTENAWNFVEGSMDTGSGIPEDALGRLASIREKGKLTVVTEPYYAPQEFIDPSKDGQEQYVGADMELARLIAERMGVELEIVPLEFSEVLSSIREGTYDLAISGLAYTPGRAASMALSKGYYYSNAGASTGFVVRTGDRDAISGIEDLKTRSIVAQRGSVQELLAAEHVTRYHQFQRLASMNEVYAAVEDGLADAGAADIETAELYISHNPQCGLSLVKDIRFELEEQFLGDRIAAPPGELQLVYFVNGVIDEVLENGTYEEWFQEYSELAEELGL